MTFIIENLDRGDNLLSAANEIRVKQNPGFGEFGDIASALASISGSSDTNRFVIKVFPGIYIEPELDFASKPYVSMVGSSIESVTIKPAGSHNIILLGLYNEISFLGLEDSPVGYYAIYINDSGDYSQAHKVTFNNCNRGILVESSTQDTIFYGEYLDFNGSFEYGTVVSSSNGFKAIANLENYYIFPADILTFVSGLLVQGVDTDVEVLASGFKGADSGIGIEVVDGATLLLNAVYISNFDRGLVNQNIGAAATIRTAATQLYSNVTTDIELLRPMTKMALIGSADQSKIISNTSEFIHGYINVVTGEYEISNKLAVTFDDGTHTDLSTLLVEGGTMGVIEGGLISDDNGTLDLFVAEGFGYLDNGGVLKRYDWVDTVLTLSPNTTHQIYLNNNGILDAYLVTPASLSNSIYLGKVRTGSSTIEFIDTSKMNAHHIGNTLSTFNRVALGNIYASGSAISEGTALKLNVTSGLYFRSENVYAPQGGTDITFTQYNKNGSSTFVTSTTDTVNNSQYNNGNTLSSLTAGYYTKHSLYVIGDAAHGNEKYLLVLGQAEYSTLLLAQAGDLATPPTYFDRGVVLIGIIYVQQSSGNIVLIEDARPIIGFKPITTAGVSDHSSLSGLGNNDHPQYLLASGASAMAGDLDLGGNNITNVNLVDGVDVSAHASRHLPNGADPLTTAAPTTNLGGSSTNAVGIQNSLSRSDHSHAIDVANTSTTGLLTSTDWNTFNGKQNTITPAVLSKIDDTNVTLTLGGTPLTALLQSVSLTLGWTGTLADSRITSAATWNAKQAALSGTGIVKSTAGTISYLTDNSTNWDTAYSNRITSLTTTGSSGASTLIANTLNIPTYTLAGLGGTTLAAVNAQNLSVFAGTTKAQFDTLCSDGNFLYVGDITQYTDEQAQDAVGAMIDTTLVYVDATPLLTRAALTGDVTASQGSNATTIANDVVTNAKLNNMATSTFKGRITAGTGDPEDLTIANAKTLLGLGGKNEVFFDPWAIAPTAVTVPTAAAATVVSQSSVTGLVAISYSGTADQNASVTFRVPTDYLSGGRFKILWSTSNTSGNNIVFAPILTVKSLGASLATITETLTAQTIAAGTVNLLQETGFFTPVTSFTAGQFVVLRVTRPSSSNAADTQTQALFVNGVIFEYDSSK